MVALQDLKNSVNGRLVALFRNDKEAYELLKSIGFPLQFGQVLGVDLAERSIVGNYYTSLGKIANTLEINRSSTHYFFSIMYKDMMKSIGVFQTSNVDICKSILQGMGEKARVTTGNNKPVFFLSARSIVFFLLCRDYKFSRRVSDKLGIPCNNDPLVLARMSGIEPIATPAKQTKKESKPDPITSDFEIKIVSVPSPLTSILNVRRSYVQSLDQQLKTVIEQINDLEQKKQEIEQQRSTTDQEIEALQMALELLSTDTKQSSDNGNIE